MPADALAPYPAWAQNLARSYFTGTLTQFVLHGNVRDLVPGHDAEGARQYVPLRRFLHDDLFAARDLRVYYDRSAGIHFEDETSKRDFARAVSGYDALFGTEYGGKLPRDPARVFALLDNYFRLRLSEGKRLACVVDYAETVVPMAEAAHYSGEDRTALVFLQKWAQDPFFARHDFTLCLVAEGLGDLNQQLVKSPFTAEVQLPYPNEAARRAFIEHTLDGRTATFAERSDVPPARLAELASGLNLVQLRTLLADVLENAQPLTFETLSARKKAMIEEAAQGLLAFVPPDGSLDRVAGHTEAKAHLRQAARALRAGRGDALPMGYLVAGPVGTGKTFLVSQFAGEVGVPMVTLQNFRSQWQGATEGNLERILGLLDAMAPVAVLIDEADAALGDRDAGGDSGVSQRVFAKIASFMSRPQNRGRIIFFLVTARPDLMPVDLKRQGRAEEHLALFYPTSREEREELVQVMLRRTGLQLALDDLPEDLFDEARSLSGADMEALFTRAKFRAAARTEADGTREVTPDDLQAAVNDFIPPTYPTEVELQTLAAVMECTSRALLPPRFRDADREEMAERLDELKRLV